MRLWLVWLISLLALIQPAHAQDAAHLAVRPALVHLIATGTPSTGPMATQPGGAVSQASGFLVGDDGFLITTQHFFDPLSKVEAVNIEITARIGDSQGDDFPVYYVTSLPDVDLALLRVDFPFSTTVPKGLTIGSSARLRQGGDTLFLTSGFQDSFYLRKKGGLIQSEARSVPYAWTLDLKTDAGQSGSPVYVEGEAGVPEVVGVVKGTLATNDEVTLMIPIEYTLPLIGQFQIERLSREVDALKQQVGALQDGERPLVDRVSDVEDEVGELSRHFSWSVNTDPSGALVISYEKLVPDGPQVDRIKVQVTPYMRVYSGPERNLTDILQDRPMKLAANDPFNTTERSSLDARKQVGTFVIPNVQEKLELKIDLEPLAVGGRDPFRDLEVIIVPEVEGVELEREQLTVVPRFVWKQR